MNIKFLFWLFFIVCLAAHSCQSSFASKSRNVSPLKQGKQLKYGYGMFSTESSKKDQDRKHGKALESHYHSSLSKKAKAIYGGANDMKRPRSKNGSTSTRLKSNLFFSAALKHLAVGFLICAMLII